MTEEDCWEIDPATWTLNDLIELQEKAEGIRAGVVGVKDMRALLARLVVNKTEEEIGQVPLTELPDRLADLNAAIDEHLSIPKATATP